MCSSFSPMRQKGPVSCFLVGFLSLLWRRWGLEVGEGYVASHSLLVMDTYELVS